MARAHSQKKAPPPSPNCASLPPACTDLLADCALLSDRPTQNTLIWMTRAVISASAGLRSATFRDDGGRLQAVPLTADRPGLSSSLRCRRSTWTAVPGRQGSQPRAKESGGQRTWPLIMTWCTDKGAVNTRWPRSLGACSQFSLPTPSPVGGPGPAFRHLGWDGPGTPPLRAAPRCGTPPTHRPLTGPEARFAVLARGDDPPGPPAARRAPLPYSADTPAAHRAGGPVRCAGPGGRPPGTPRCAPRPATVLRRHTGRSPGRRPGSLDRYERLAVAR